MKIYVSGPYTANTIEQMETNVAKAIDAGLALYQKGHYPYIPHLTHYIDNRAKETRISMSWEDYMEWDKSWLVECDAILYLGNSKGADIELELAKNLKKVVYTSVESVPKTIRG